MERQRGESLKQFAASLGISFDSAYRAARTGRLKVIRFGRRVIVPADEIERVSREGLSPQSGRGCANE